MTKKPDRDKHQLKERQKIESGVFDRQTLISISKILKKGIIDNMDYPVSTGKEAIVFKCTSSSGSSIALKIYKISTSIFLKKMDYMHGDPRFSKIKLGERDIVFSFARKEFRNLEICEKAGVSAPKPIFLQGNVLVMGFLGESGLPYPQLVQTVCEEKFLDSILADVRRLYGAGLVHADLSEYNIMVGNDGTTYLIDFGQGVVLAHPKAEEFLERDVRNVIKFFAKSGVVRDLEEELKKIRG